MWDQGAHQAGRFFCHMKGLLWRFTSYRLIPVELYKFLSSSRQLAYGIQHQVAKLPPRRGRYWPWTHSSKVHFGQRCVFVKVCFPWQVFKVLSGEWLTGCPHPSQTGTFVTLTEHNLPNRGIAVQYDYLVFAQGSVIQCLRSNHFILEHFGWATYQYKVAIDSTYRKYNITYYLIVPQELIIKSQCWKTLPVCLIRC